MKYAIIDLGTNTCNLLIAETKATGYSILHQSKELVKLGDNQISNNALSDAAMQRAVNVLRLQREISESNRAEKIIVIATSAVRDAVNKSIFRKLIKRETGLELKIISGEKEADLIFKGVLLALNTLDTPAMILDIGGGSNEIIISKSKTMLWKESRPAGMARVINKFALSDPICDKEIRQLSQFFKAAHAKSIDFSKKEKVTTLIGCSGAFDTIADIIDQANPG
ncbi:MAG: exopolyphosphatase, partial [Draconibacterium sp.]